MTMKQYIQLQLITGLLALIKCQQIYSGHDMMNPDVDFSNLPMTGRCESITSPSLCEGLQYNETIFPNLLGHTKQDAAYNELYQYLPLVKVQCSSSLQIFLCSVFIPVCTQLEVPIPPCQSLCLAARNGCESLMKRFGFSWPENLDCARFPTGNNKGDIRDMCISDPNPSAPQPVIPNPHPDPKEPYPPYGPPYMPGPSIRVDNITHGLPFKCPLNFKVPAGLEYTFRIQGIEHKNCGMPCDELLVDSTERDLIRKWTGVWAIFCVISTAFTVITYYIEPNRFNFPERSIIYLSWCYFFIGLVFVFGFFFGDTISCNDPFANTENHPNLKMIRTITQGNKKEKCTISFMILYYFTISNSIWWVVLTITWFMTSALQWGQEFIEANSNCFHFFSWAISGIMTVIVLVLNKIEGDFLTGACFIGIWNPTNVIAFVLIPLSTLLLIGFFFFISGFVSLMRMRPFIKTKNYHTEQMEAMDRQMLRIGVYSVFYFLPTLILLACFYYEQENVDSFIMSWLSSACGKREYGIPCPSANSLSHISASQYKKPNFLIYFAKYLAWLMPGIVSGFWICSEKTISTWSTMFRRIFCLKPQHGFV